MAAATAAVAAVATAAGLPLGGRRRESKGLTAAFEQWEREGRKRAPAFYAGEKVRP